MPRNRGSSSCRTTPHAYAQLQLGPASPRNGEVARLRRVAGRHQQARLADTRRTLHDDHASRARGHLVERIRRSRPGRALARGAGRSCPDASLWPRTPEAPDAPRRTSRPAKAHSAVEHPAGRRPFGCCRTHSPGQSKCRRTQTRHDRCGRGPAAALTVCSDRAPVPTGCNPGCKVGATAGNCNQLKGAPSREIPLEATWIAPAGGRAVAGSNPVPDQNSLQIPEERSLVYRLGNSAGNNSGQRAGSW